MSYCYIFLSLFLLETFLFSKLGSDTEFQELVANASPMQHQRGTDAFTFPVQTLQDQRGIDANMELEEVKGIFISFLPFHSPLFVRFPNLNSKN